MGWRRRLFWSVLACLLVLAGAASGAPTPTHVRFTVAGDFAQGTSAAAVISAMDGGLFDLLVLDGEAGKVGGMGLCRQLKDEIFQCPPVVVLTGRPQDAWLASWSYADGVVSRPLDPIEVQRAVAELLVAPADA